MSINSMKYSEIYQWETCMVIKMVQMERPILKNVVVFPQQVGVVVFPQLVGVAGFIPN